MRLIDVDVYCATICRCYRRECDKAKCPIHNAPNAYSVYKVVEELKCDRCESCNFLEVCAGSKCCGKCHEKAIEIVKQGGVSETERKLKEMEV